MKNEKIQSISLYNPTAAQVTQLINKAGKGTKRGEEAVYAAEAAYFHLPAAEKAKVKNLPKLLAASENLRKQYTSPKAGERLDRRNFVIGAYCFADYCWTEEHVKALADCGIDFLCSVKNDKKLLDLLAKHGVVADVGHFPGWWGGTIENNGKMAEQRPLSVYEEKLEDFADHPAVWAISISDEASAWDFPHHGKIVELMQEKLPGVLPYVNLQNAGPGLADMGAPTYDEYIEAYMRHIPLDYISYDHYMYSWGVDRAFQAYETVSRLSKAYGKDFWVVLQINNEAQRAPVTLSMLRFQAYAALAYGAKGITWACWTAGWWAQNVVDMNGEFTERYDILKTINAEIKALAPVYMWYEHEESFILDGGSSSPAVRIFLERDGKVPESTQSVFTDFQVKDRTAAQAGFFTKRNGRGHALMLLDLEDPWGNESYASPDVLKKTPVSFRIAKQNVRVSAYCQGKPMEIQPDTFGTYTVELAHNLGVFITVDEN